MKKWQTFSKWRKNIHAKRGVADNMYCTDHNDTCDIHYKTKQSNKYLRKTANTCNQSGGGG